MNFLAHILLSGKRPQLQFGNFIGDGVKGHAYTHYPPEICKGIVLHRAIDDFTDTHPLIKEEVDRMRPYFGRYASVLLDVFLDYLLASHFEQFSDKTLSRFSRSFYGVLVRYYLLLPPRFKRFIWHFIATNRLSKYQTKAGLRDSLYLMTSGQRVPISVDVAMKYLSENEERMWLFFQPFFDEMATFVRQRIEEMNEGDLL